MRNRTVRLHENTIGAIAEQCKSLRINESTFIRLALDEKLRGAGGSNALDKRIASEVVRIKRDQNYVLVLLESLIKVFLVRVPGPVNIAERVAQSEEMYAKFLQWAALSAAPNKQPIRGEETA